MSVIYFLKNPYNALDYFFHYHLKSVPANPPRVLGVLDKARNTHQFFAGCDYTFADVILSLWYFEFYILAQFQRDWMLSFSFSFTQKSAEGGD